MTKVENVTIKSTVIDSSDRETRIDMIYSKLYRWAMEKKLSQDLKADQLKKTAQ